MYSRLKLIVAVASMTAVVNSVNAQVLYEPIYSPSMMMALHNNKFNPIVNGVIEKGRDKSATPGKSTKVETTPATALVFKQSAARTRTNFANFVSKTSTTDPEGAKKMAALFASTDVIAMFGKSLAPYGLRTNDVSHAYTVWWMNAWQAANGLNDDFDKPTAQAVAGQAARGLLSSPQFTSASETQKQEFAEAMLIQAAMIGSAQTTFAKDPKMLQQLATSVKQGAKASGIDLDLLVLTPQGFKSTVK